MAINSIATLVVAIRQHGLLGQGQLEELVNQLQGRFSEPKGLAKELIERGWLTPYQVNQLFQGRGDNLVLGQYVLLERLGEGGMGQVFKARHRHLDRVDALKIIRQENLTSPHAIRRFYREIQSAAQLSHPNVVHAYDADEVHGVHFYAMEYVDGTDLAKRVKQSGPLPVDEACDYVRQAALGLQHAYERGVIHRDIKPANLLVTKPPVPAVSTASRWGLIKILDMGLARLNRPSAEEETGSSTLTQEGAVMGTLDFIAPEQAMNSSAVDIRADLYSLGCTFYYLLTGKVPFPGGEALEKLAKHCWEKPVPVEELRPEVGPQIAMIVRRLMAKEPKDRFQTPAELMITLAGILSAGKLPAGLDMPPLAQGNQGGITQAAGPPTAATATAPQLAISTATVTEGSGDTADDWDALLSPLSTTGSNLSTWQLRRAAEQRRKRLLVVAAVVLFIGMLALVVWLACP